MNDKYAKDKTIKIVLDYASDSGQFTLRDVVESTGYSIHYLRKILLELEIVKGIHRVGTDKRGVRHYNIRKEWFIEPVVKRKKFKTAGVDREPIKITFSDAMDIFNNCLVFGKPA